MLYALCPLPSALSARKVIELFKDVPPLFSKERNLKT